MEKSGLKFRILMEIERLIVQTSTSRKTSERCMEFHKSLIKKYFNASDVIIDYHRRRVKMNLVVDDQAYNPEEVNIDIPVMPMNLYYLDLTSFLRSCVEEDDKSLAFYARLIKEHKLISSKEMSA